MKYLSYLLLPCLLIACHSVDRRTDNNQPSDTIKSVNSSNDKAEPNDSAASVTKEESIIIGPIRFGMNNEEYKIAEDSFQHSTRIRPEGSEKYDHALGSWLFHNGHHLYWKDEGVYGMVMEGLMILPKDYETKLRSNADQLVTALSEKYGEPDVRNDIPDQNKIEVNYDFDIATWNIGKKRIVAAIHNSGSNFYTQLNIYQPDMYPRKEANTFH